MNKSKKLKKYINNYKDEDDYEDDDDYENSREKKGKYVPKIKNNIIQNVFKSIF